MRGYFVEMGEHPQTIGYALADSPVGMAAWMLDHDADSYEKISRAFLDGQPSGGLTREHIVDNMTLYWLTNTATSSARLYWEDTETSGRPGWAEAARPQAPGGVHRLPRRALPGAAHWAEKVYPNLTYYHEADRGGHFAAWEEPELFRRTAEAFRTLHVPQIPGPRR